MTGWIIFASSLGWILCGFLGVLIEIGFWKRFYYESSFVGWNTTNNFLATLIFIIGPIGLLSVIILSLSEYRKIHMAIYIPNEIRAPTKELQLLNMVTQMIAEGDFSRVEIINAEINELMKKKAKKAKELRKRVFI